MGETSQAQEAQPQVSELKFDWHHSFFDLAARIRAEAERGKTEVVVAFQDPYFLEAVALNHEKLADSLRRAIAEAGLPPGDLSVQRDSRAALYSPYSQMLVYRLQ